MVSENWSLKTNIIKTLSNKEQGQIGDKKPPEFVIDNQSSYYIHPSYEL